MKKQAVRFSVVALAVVFTLALDHVAAENREAGPGFVRRVRSADAAKAGGPDCANATVIPTSPGGEVAFADSDNSCGNTNKIDDYNNFGTGGPCNTVDYPGPDLIYAFTSTDPNGAQIMLSPTAPTDMGVFVLSDCPNGLSCVAFEDQIGSGAVSSVVLRNQPPGTYYVYVDSYYSTGPESCGDYILTFFQIPVELMQFTVE